MNPLPGDYTLKVLTDTLSVGGQRINNKSPNQFDLGFKQLYNIKFYSEYSSKTKS